MNTSPPSSTRRTWFVIFGALVVSIFVYGLICFAIEHNNSPRHADPSLATARPILIALGLIDLVASIAWLRFRVDGKIGDGGRALVLSPGEFQTYSIMALALSEACTIFGLILFFIGAPLSEFAVFALGTLFVDLAFILPCGLQFWSAYEGAGRL